MGGGLTNILKKLRAVQESPPLFRGKLPKCLLIMRGLGPNLS